MRAALYIDCNSIDIGDIPFIYEEIQKTDEVVLDKMFEGGMDDPALRNMAKERRIQLCEEDSETSAMVSLAVSAMADAAICKVDRVYIATGNNAVIPLLDKLRTMEMKSVVMGPCCADRKLVRKADRYIYVDILAGRPCTAEMADVRGVAECIYSIVSYYKGIGIDADMEHVHTDLVRKYPDFDVRNYGYTHLATFIKNNVPGVCAAGDGMGNIHIQVVDDRDELDAFAYEYMTARDYKIEDMSELLAALKERFPGFVIENYGYHTEYGFVLSFPKFEIWNNKGIKMKRTFKLSSGTPEDV